MLSPAQACDRAAALVDRAVRLGADAADAAFVAEASESVTVRLGKLEDVERSEGEHMSLRVFCGKRSASIGTSDLSDAALDELAARALDMARAAPDDPYAGLAPREALATPPWAELDLAEADSPAPEQLRMTAQAAEEAGRDVKGVTNSEGGSASAGNGIFALATSEGFAGGYASTSRGLSASVVAGEGSGMQRDYAWRQARHGEDLPTPEWIGRTAGERAVARLEPGRLKSGPMPVVFDPRIGGSLVGHLIGAMSGASIARKASFLLDRLEEQLFDSAVVIAENPLCRRGLRSRPFDGEGVPTRARNLVDRGRVTGWLLNVAAARQLGLGLTGHASRGHGGAPGISTGNIHLAAGEMSPSELMSDIADGVYVTELIGHGANPVTGDYSVGASGRRIAGGELAGPVAEFTIAGNLIDMFRALVPANDLEWYRAVNVPTLRIDGMTIAGD